jgi:AcrR family transcriptional regulator
MKKETKDTKNRIIDSTLDLIDKKPFPEVRTKEIAKKAGISEVTVFRYFDSKSSIFNTLIDRFIDFINPADFSNITKEEEFREELIRSLRLVCSVNYFKRKMLKFFLYVGMYREDTFFQFVNISNSQIFGPVEECVEYGKKYWGYGKKINTKIQVRLFINSIFLFIIQQKVFMGEKIEKYDFDEIIITSVDNFLKSLK